MFRELSEVGVEDAVNPPVNRQTCVKTLHSRNFVCGR